MKRTLTTMLIAAIAVSAALAVVSTTVISNNIAQAKCHLPTGDRLPEGARDAVPSCPPGLIDNPGEEHAGR